MNIYQNLKESCPKHWGIYTLLALAGMDLQIFLSISGFSLISALPTICICTIFLG